MVSKERGKRRDFDISTIKLCLLYYTWPELSYCAIDLYTCGEATSTDKAAEFLTYKLGSTNQVKKDLVRDPVRKD